MYFQLNSPSIPAIRAKFLIEKLRAFRQNDVSISLCATGRAGSGKTTLGNRLIGIDYFMPSTGRQDCTDEVNLVEFPIGLKYFDLPGVCSDDRLENHNRAALGINQIDDFDIIDTLTLAKYTEKQSTPQQKFSVANFQETQLNPDLIFYLIAPDKLFLQIDIAYLRDLLKKHRHKIIYIFNIFADKETGKTFSATEQNITDVTTIIQKVHTSIVGPDNPPIIVPINCWTGEGISELASYSHQMLGNEKGKIFEELIQYQQQKTPNEYLFQIKRELIRLFSYVACQKPEATYTCNQPIHQACHTLWDFLANFCDKTGQTESHLIEQIITLINQVLSKPLNESTSKTVNSLEEDITDDFDYLNERTNLRLIKAKNIAIKFRDSQVKNSQKEIAHYKQQIHSFVEKIESSIKKYEILEKEANILQQQTDDGTKERNSISEEMITISGKQQSHESKYQRIFQKINKLEKKCNKIKREYPYSFILTYRYNTSIDEKTEKLKKQKKKCKRRRKQLEYKTSKFNQVEQSVRRLANLYVSKSKNLVEYKQNLQNERKLLSEKGKLCEDYSLFAKEVCNSFESEFNSASKAREIEDCVAKIAINKLIVDVIMKCTTYHFDSTGECKYNNAIKLREKKWYNKEIQR